MDAITLDNGPRTRAYMARLAGARAALSRQPCAVPAGFSTAEAAAFTTGHAEADRYASNGSGGLPGWLADLAGTLPEPLNWEERTLVAGYARKWPEGSPAAEVGPTAFGPEGSRHWCVYDRDSEQLVAEGLILPGPHAYAQAKVAADSVLRLRRAVTEYSAACRAEHAARHVVGA